MVTAAYFESALRNASVTDFSVYANPAAPRRSFRTPLEGPNQEVDVGVILSHLIFTLYLLTNPLIGLTGAYLRSSCYKCWNRGPKKLPMLL